MKKEQTLGALRAFLTTLGSALATWGLADPAGGAWAPVTGLILAAASLVWGTWFHRDPATPGRLRWSLVRKLGNALFTALVTYGVTSSETAATADLLLANLGPLLVAMGFSVADNQAPSGNGGGKGSPPGSSGGGATLLLLALAALLATGLLTGCSATIDENGRWNITPHLPTWQAATEHLNRGARASRPHQAGDGLPPSAPRPAATSK